MEINYKLFLKSLLIHKQDEDNNFIIDKLSGSQAEELIKVIIIDNNLTNNYLNFTTAIDDSGLLNYFKSLTKDFGIIYLLQISNGDIRYKIKMHNGFEKEGTVKGIL